MLIPVSYLLAAYRFKIGTDPEEMVTTCGHFSTVDDATTQANALFDAWRDEVFPVWAGADVTFVGVTVQEGTQTSGLGPYIVGQSTLPPQVSVGVGALVPQNTAVLVTKLTNTAGRRGRGRMYVPGTATEDAVNNVGTLTPTAVSTRQTEINDWFARLVAEGHTPVVLHATPPPTGTPITGFVVQSMVATQRRRLRR